MSNNGIDIIRTLVPEPAMYEQLAEECAELAQAALKMSRVLRGENKTPKTKEVVQQNLIEEYSDIMLCASALDLKCDYNQIERKLNRWIDRNKDN